MTDQLEATGLTTAAGEPIPAEFHPERVAEASPEDEQLTEGRFWSSGEPYRSLLAANPWLRPPDPSGATSHPDFSIDPPPCPLFEAGRGNEGGGLDGTPYYDTTVARRHDYWRRFDDLPVPTRDIRRARHHLRTYGYCLIADALSERQRTHMLARLTEQAEAEREMGLADITPHFHIMWTLVNKGECFAGCVAFDPAWVQAGPVIAQLNRELLGPGHYAYSFASNIARPGSWPQGLHQDSAAIHPIQTPWAPVLVNTVYLMEDVNDVNGGTLVIPTSHRLVSTVPPGEPMPALPPAVNIEAPGGTVMLMDGRLLHGTGVNHTDRWRFIMTQSNVRPWLRQQENWQLSVALDVLDAASPELLARLGYTTSGIIEVATYSTVRTTVEVRRAMETDGYRRIRELRPPVAPGVRDNLTLYRMKQAIDARRAARPGNGG